MASASQPHQPTGQPYRAPVWHAGPTPKRVKTEIACSNCRVLRRRCNGSTPCKACFEDRLQCDYGGVQHTPKRMTLTRAIREIAELEARLSLYERPKTSNASLFATNSKAWSMSARLLNLSSAPSKDDDMTALLEGVNNLTVSTRFSEFYGGSSPNAILEALDTGSQRPRGSLPESIDPAELTKRPSISDDSSLKLAPVAVSLLPPKDVADAYVHLYFQTSHRLFPVLKCEAFMERYKKFWDGLLMDGKGSELWMTVLYMVLALGHQCSTIDADPDVCDAALDSKHGEICYNLAKQAPAEVPFSGGDIFAVNSLFLAFVWLYNQQRLHEAYAVLGTAARVGYSTGLHRHRTAAHTLPPEREAWKATWWCLFIYETELAAFSGRPCSIQPTEVDVQPFPLDSGPTDLQFLERLRQFSLLTWDAYEQVYGLSLMHTGVEDRVKILATSDKTICSWYDDWANDCLWAVEPHGLIFRLRILNVRILLHRTFLSFAIQQRKHQKPTMEKVTTAASTCTDLAFELIKVATTSFNLAVRGASQGGLFQIMGYLWNAAVTLLLSTSDPFIEQDLKDSMAAHVNSAIAFFSTYCGASGFAKTAAPKAQQLLEKILVPADRSPDEMLDFMPSFDYTDFLPFDNEAFDLDFP